MNHPPPDNDRYPPQGPRDPLIDPDIDGVIIIKCTKSVLLGREAQSVEERVQFKREFRAYQREIFDPHPAFQSLNLLRNRSPAPPAFNGEGDITDAAAMQFMQQMCEPVAINTLGSRWSVGPIMIDDHTCCDSPGGHVKKLDFLMGLWRPGVSDILPWTLNDVVTRHIARGWSMPSVHAERQLRVNPIRLSLVWKVR